MNCFSSDNSQFVQISLDKRIKVFEVLENRSKEIELPDKVAGKITCLATYRFSDFEYLAIGTSKGQIFQVNLHKGQFSNCQSPLVNAAHFGQIKSLVPFSAASNAQSAPLLYFAGEDKTIRITTMIGDEKGKKKRRDSSLNFGHSILAKLPIHANKMAINRNGTLLAVAEAAIKLIDISSKKEVAMFSAHINNIVTLTFLSAIDNSGKDYLVSSSADRIVYLWDCSFDSHFGFSKPLKEFACSEFPNFIDYHFISADQSIFLAVSKYIELWYKSKNQNSAELSRTPTLKISAPKQLSIINASLQIASETAVFLVLACETSASEISLHRFNILDKKDSLREDLKRVIQDLGDNKKSGFGASDLGRPNSSGVPAKKPTSQAVASEIVPSAAPRSKQELSMEEILRSQEKASAVTNLSVDSITSVLITAIQSEDLALLQKCVSKPTSFEEGSNSRSSSALPSSTIKNTLYALPVPYINSLIPLLVKLYKSVPSAGESVFSWIIAIFQVHSAWLVSSEHINTSISELYVLLEERTSHYKEILRLEGRLEIISSNIAKRSSAFSKIPDLVGEASLASDEEDMSSVSSEDEEDEDDENSEEIDESDDKFEGEEDSEESEQDHSSSSNMSED